MNIVGTVGNIWFYLNPWNHLGDRQYQVLFPVITLTLLSVFLEVVFVVLLDNPAGVSIFAIALYVISIVYFAFRMGIKGGMMAVFLTIIYYLYIIYSRRLMGAELISSLNSTLLFFFIYSGIVIVIGWLKQSVDVHIEREVNARKRMTTIIKQLPVGLVITDLAGKIVEINNAMKKVIGPQIKSGDIIGSDLFQFFSPNSKSRLKDEQYPLYRALRSGQVISNKELILHNELGKEYQILVSSSPIFDRSNRIVAGVSIYQDVTALRDLEKRKDDFVNMASHELRTPITSLTLNLTYLKNKLRQGDLEKAMSAMPKIEKQTDNLMNIITSLLDVSRYQVGKMTYAKSIFRLDQLIEEAIDSMQAVSRQQVVRIIRKFRCNVYGDRYRINQVITNLITNAYKFSRKPGEIKIYMTRREQMIEVAVSDKGVGIPKSQHKKIFEKLYQIHDKESGTYPGFGMGLYIAKEIIRHHKGKIWVDSEEGKGSIFTFSLPIAL